MVIALLKLHLAVGSLVLKGIDGDEHPSICSKSYHPCKTVHPA